MDSHIMNESIYNLIPTEEVKQPKQKRWVWEQEQSSNLFSISLLLLADICFYNSGQQQSISYNTLQTSFKLNQYIGHFLIWRPMI